MTKEHLRPIDVVLSIAARRGWKRSELARRLGESAQTITNWSARGLPPAKYAHVAAQLGCSVDTLLSRQTISTDDGRILIPVTSREELCLELFKKLTPEQQEVTLHDLRLAADANRITERVKGSPVARHVSNLDMEVAYGMPRQQGEHPKAR